MIRTSRKLGLLGSLYLSQGLPYGFFTQALPVLMLGGLESITGAIVGARSAEQVDGFIGAMDFRLSDEEFARIGAELPESVSLL